MKGKTKGHLPGTQPEEAGFLMNPAGQGVVSASTGSLGSDSVQRPL